jgi:hypothetical protein
LFQKPDRRIATQLEAIAKEYEAKIKGLSERIRTESFAEAAHVAELCYELGPRDLKFAVGLLKRAVTAKEAGLAILEARADADIEIHSHIIPGCATDSTSRREGNAVVKECERIAARMLAVHNEKLSQTSSGHSR